MANKIPTHIVKFPGVDVPSELKVENFAGYLPVEMFTPPGHHSVQGPQIQSASRMDRMLPVQDCDPVQIAMDPKLVPLVNKLCGKGELIGKEIKLIELARDDDDSHTESEEYELTGPTLEKMGNSVVVTYNKFTSKSYMKDKPPKEGGYDFEKQKKLD